MDGFSFAGWLSAAFGLAFLPYLSESHENRAPYADQATGKPSSAYDDLAFDFDGLPGTQHEFKVDVAPGRQECFHQMIQNAANIHVSFEVLKGADRNIDVIFAGPNGQVLDKHQYKPQGNTDIQAPVEGVYTVCIDNSFSRFTPKLVYLFWVSYVPEEWQKYSQDIDDFQESFGNAASSLTNVSQNVNKMRNQQASARQRMVKDFYAVKGNETYIQNWSVVMCALIVGASCVQVAFVRRLFHVPAVTPTSKPRA